MQMKLDADIFESLWKITELRMKVKIEEEQRINTEVHRKIIAIKL